MVKRVDETGACKLTGNTKSLYVINFITLLYYNQPLCSIAENYYYIVVVG